MQRPAHEDLPVLAFQSAQLQLGGDGLALFEDGDLQGQLETPAGMVERLVHQHPLAVVIVPAHRPHQHVRIDEADFQRVPFL